MQKIRILVTDDHTLVRETWSAVLNSDPRFTIVGQCGTGEEAIALSKQLNPDIILMDINMPGINGIDTTAEILNSCPGSKVIAISLHTEPAYAKRMMSTGACGYVTKNSSRQEMIKAIMEVTQGKKFICDEIKEILSDQMITQGDKVPVIDSLSTREMEIARMVRSGASSKEISSSLGITVKTVEVHRYNTLKKLNLKNSAALANFMNENSFN